MLCAELPSLCWLLSHRIGWIERFANSWKEQNSWNRVNWTDSYKQKNNILTQRKAKQPRGEKPYTHVGQKSTKTKTLGHIRALIYLWGVTNSSSFCFVALYTLHLNLLNSHLLFPWLSPNLFHKTQLASRWDLLWSVCNFTPFCVLLYSRHITFWTLLLDSIIHCLYSYLTGLWRVRYEMMIISLIIGLPHPTWQFLTSKPRCTAKNRL